MSLLRRLKKLRKMSKGEIGARVSDAAVRWRERCAWQARVASHHAQRGAPPAAALSRRAALLVPGAAPDQLLALKSACPELYQMLQVEAMARAARTLAGNCELLGFSADVGGSVDWHRDPRSTHRWPRRFYATLDLYELPEGIDVKYVWELNRHQFLVELSRGWLFSGDERFAGRVRELILDWIDQNPLYEGVNWTSALEVGLRGISWLWALAALAEWPGWREADWARITASLVDHARYLSQHFSFYSSPYNHLIGEAAGLYVLSAWLDELPAAKNWRRLARRVLVEHSPRQFYPDGFCVEQATGYHFFTLGFLVHALCSSHQIGEPIEELSPIIARAYSAGAALMQPDGTWPAIGDVDSARALPVFPENFWNFESMYGLGSVLCDRPELAAVASRPGPELFWLGGTAGIRRFSEQQAKAAPANGDAPSAGRCQIQVLPDAGYCIIRSGAGPTADWLLFDCGPIAAGLFPDSTPSTAHGHADTLQVLLQLGGRAVITDPGMPFYFGPRDWVDYFRGAGAHNTVEIEDRPVARHSGRLGWSHACGAMQMHADDDPQDGNVWGRVELDAGNAVTRSIHLVPGEGAWIADVVETDRPRSVRWTWQLGEGLLRPAPVGQDRAMHRENLRLLQWNDRGLIALTAQLADSCGPLAWQSPGYGRRSPGTRLVSQETVDGSALIVTFIGFAPPASRIRVGQSELCCSETADDPSSPRLIDLTPRREMRIQAEVAQS